jgi:hypothetical protein
MERVQDALMGGPAGPTKAPQFRWNSTSQKSPRKPSREQRSRLLMLGQNLDKTETTRHLLTASKAAFHSRLNYRRL